MIPLYGTTTCYHYKRTGGGRAENSFMIKPLERFAERRPAPYCPGLVLLQKKRSKKQKARAALVDGDYGEDDYHDYDYGSDHDDRTRRQKTQAAPLLRYTGLVRSRASNKKMVHLLPQHESDLASVDMIYQVQDLCGTHPTQERCAGSCTSYVSHPAA